MTLVFIFVPIIMKKVVWKKLLSQLDNEQYDEKMFQTVADCGLPYILMHSNATYQNMHEKIVYDDITVAVNQYF